MSETWDEKRERKRKEKAVKEEDDLCTAQTIAILLGAVVLPCPAERDYGYNGNYPATFPDGREISLGFGAWGNKGKVHVSGSYPKDSTNRMYGKSAGSINVSELKTPEQIAKDIKRRFMPAYDIAYKYALECKQKSDEYEAKKEARKVLLCSVPGITRSNYNDHLHISCKGISGSVTYLGDNSLSVDLRNVPIDMLINLLSP